MKNINIDLEDVEYHKLKEFKETKGYRSWKEMFLDLISGEEANRKLIAESLRQLRLVFPEEIVEILKAILIRAYLKNSYETLLKKLQEIDSEI